MTPASGPPRAGAPVRLQEPHAVLAPLTAALFFVPTADVGGLRPPSASR